MRLFSSFARISWSSQRILSLLAIGVGLVLIASPAWAGTGGNDMPWNTPFQALLDNLTGTTARVLAGIMLLIGGVVWGFTRHEEGAKRIGQAIFGIALMFGAVQIVAALQFAGAVV
ncbi:MAG TPA: TrbC/VirB2 family protein [Gemmatimonadaceae bacterium]|jgi:type IV secretory pathway VirB2 component (pilin)|nr:TrbC/VirB2 family protein [Gemmatimonadaceae bacterium]